MTGDVTAESNQTVRGDMLTEGNEVVVGSSTIRSGLIVEDHAGTPMDALIEGDMEAQGRVFARQNISIGRNANAEGL